MKHKIILQDYHYQCGDGCCDEYGVHVYIDGKRLEMDGEMTYNCLQEILDVLGVDAEVICEDEDN